MAIAYAQSAKGVGTSASTSIATSALTTTNGNLLVVGITWSGSRTFSSISDSKSNTWTQIGTEKSTVTVPVKTRFYYAKNISGGASHTVTASFSGNGCYPVIIVMEISGADTSAPFDVYAEATGGASTTPSSGATTTRAQANEILVSFVAEESTNTCTHTAGTNFTKAISEDAGNTNGTAGMEYRVVSSTGTDAGTWTIGQSVKWACHVATFKAAGGTAYTLTAAQGSSTLTGQAVTPKAARTLAAAYASDTLAGQAALLKRGYRLTSAYGANALTGQSVNLKSARTISSAQGNLALTGQIINLKSARVIAMAYGSDALTGQAANIKAARTLANGLGNYALSGQIVAPRTSRAMAVATGSDALTGQNAGLFGGRKIANANGGLTLVGQNAALFAVRQLGAAHDAFVLTGLAATLTYSPHGAYVLSVGNGAYAVVGNNAGLRSMRKIALDYVALTMGGENAALGHGYTLASSAGNYALGGFSALMEQTRWIRLYASDYAVAGQSVSFNINTNRAFLVVPFSTARSKTQASVPSKGARTNRARANTSARLSGQNQSRVR